MDCRPESAQGQRFLGRGAGISEQSSYLQKYKARKNHVEVNRVTYFQWLTLFNFTQSTPRPVALPRILDYFPKYKSETEDYARVKLTPHHPFRNIETQTLSPLYTTQPKYLTGSLPLVKSTIFWATMMAPAYLFDHFRQPQPTTPTEASDRLVKTRYDLAPVPKFSAKSAKTH